MNEFIILIIYEFKTYDVHLTFTSNMNEQNDEEHNYLSRL